MKNVTAPSVFEKRARRKRIVFAIALIVLLVSFLCTCCIGRYPVTFADMVSAFGAGEKSMGADVFLKIRLPRAFFSALCGMALAVSGYAYQELFSNPLASPDVLGASAGASVGASAAILAGVSGFIVSGASLAGGLAAVALAVMLARLMGIRRGTGLILAGIVVKAVCDSVIMAFKYTADPDGTLAAIEYRLMGSFQTVRSENIVVPTVMIIIPLVFLYAVRWRIQILTLGDDEAISLGLSAGSLRILCIAAATIPAAASVSVTGVVAWTGLIVPHAVRFFAGDDFVKNFGICALSGGVFMLWTDTAARSVSAAEIPISILTSLLGALFLVAVLIQKNRFRAGSDDIR